MFKSIFINAETREVVSVNLNDQLIDTYELIGCDYVEGSIYLEGNDLLVIDEEGLFKSDKSGFYFDDAFVYGNGMIWGADDDGDSADCKTDIDSVLSRINWVDKDMSEKIRNSRMNTSPIVLSW
jgi:hypothetical protein